MAKNIDIHNEALQRFDKTQAAQKDERQQCLNDRRFYSVAGAQWEGEFEDQFENKPRLEVNKVHLSVIRIINEYRNNRITVDFVNKYGASDDKLSDALDGLFRADEQDSNADEAYDNAFEEAVGGGIGAWRLRAEYEDPDDPDDDRQRIRIEPIYDADSCVFFDLDAKRQDKSDARYCFVLTPMTHAAFEAQYEAAELSTWNKAVHGVQFDWVTNDSVYVAEYFKVDEKPEVIHVFETIDGEEERMSDTDIENDPDKYEMLMAVGAKEIRTKTIKKRVITKHVLSGNGVLEDEKILPGREIPIVMTHGKRWFVDNVERSMGHVRLAKDAQRLKNMQLSKLAELSALSSIEKPIFTAEQMAGHEDMWSEDNILNYPYMLLNAITDKDGQMVAAGPVGYTKPPQISPAMAALLQLTEQDMKDILGNQEMSEEIGANMSGKAVELRQNRLDMQTFIYVSNFAKAIKRSGIIWLSMARDLLVEDGREMKSISDQGTVGKVILNKPVVEDGVSKRVNDLSKAKYDVVVDVGPSSHSKKAATVRALTQMIQITADPQTKAVLEAMTMMNMEGEGIGDVHEYFRQKLLRMGVIKPTDEEAQQLAAEAQNQQPDPQAQLAMAMAQAEAAKAAKAQSEIELNQAKVQKTEAEAIETLAGVPVHEAERAQAMSESLLNAQQGVQPPNG